MIDNYFFKIEDTELSTFENVISLGYFCSISIDLEKRGLRKISYPFDWLLTNSFEKVIKEIETSFDNFLNFNDMQQEISKPERYKNSRTDMVFFHDFDKYVPLEKQFDKQKKKYERRIHRFLNDIKKPTLFIRYLNIKNNDDIWVDENIDKIISLIKKYNEHNEIIFISDDIIKTHAFAYYYVPIDIDDVVCRTPLFANKELDVFFNGKTPFFNREENVLFSKKRKNRKTIMWVYKRIFLKPYRHSKQYKEESI